MYIYSKEKLKNTEIIGSKLLITYLEEDDEKVKVIKETLDERGIYYSAISKNLKTCKKNIYIPTIEREIDECKIATIVLSNAFFEERNKELQTITWYEVGRMLGENKKVVLYFLDIDKDTIQEKLYRTPVRQIQGCSTLYDLLEFSNKNHILENHFYADSSINRFASKRIFYTKITTVFNIYRQNIKEIQGQLNRFSDIEYDEKGALDLFLQELVCGCTVLRFNRKECLGKEFSPYFKETDILLKDFPSNFQYIRPEVLDYSSADDIFATIKSDFILPVHSLLGVDFKFFVAIKKRSKFKTDNILSIIKKNYNTLDLSDRDIYIKNSEHLQRVYFLLDLDVVDAQGLDVGTKAHYMFPQ